MANQCPTCTSGQKEFALCSDIWHAPEGVQFTHEWPQGSEGSVGEKSGGTDRAANPAENSGQATASLTGFVTSDSSEQFFKSLTNVVIAEIESSTGPTGGWLDSPKAICASIVAAMNARRVESLQAEAQQV